MSLLTTLRLFAATVRGSSFVPRVMARLGTCERACVDVGERIFPPMLTQRR